MASPSIAIVAAGAMGAAVGKRLTLAGQEVLTELDGRTAETCSRAAAAGLQAASLSEIATRADWVLSVLPPAVAYSFAERFRDAHANVASQRPTVFVDCNAISPATAQKIAKLFADIPIKFIDACIVGYPPSDTYKPSMYASCAPEDLELLDVFSSILGCAARVLPMREDGNVGAASAVKMAWAVGVRFFILAMLSSLPFAF